MAGTDLHNRPNEQRPVTDNDQCALQNTGIHDYAKDDAYHEQDQRCVGRLSDDVCAVAAFGTFEQPIERTFDLYGLVLMIEFIDDFTV